MIPKVIHYCWFGGNPLSADSQKCIESWKKYCPDYEIRRWDETNVDFNECQYAIEAYQEGKWAFVSDYVRFKILYENGGLYFDTDVELIKPINVIIKNGSFMGCENSIDEGFDNSIGVAPGLRLGVNPGLGLGANPGLGLYREILEFYKTLHFKNPDGSLNLKTVVEYTTELLSKHGLNDTNSIQCVEGITIYPKEYFNPMDIKTGKINILENTVSIHHYAGSWLDEKGKKRGEIYRFLCRLLGVKGADFVRSCFGKN